MRAGASRSRAPAGKFRRLKIGIGDRALKTAATRPVPSVSNFRVRRGPQNAGLCAAYGDVSQFRECVAGAGGFEPPDGGIKIRCLTTWLRPKAPQRLFQALAESARTIVRAFPCRNGRRRDFASRHLAATAALAPRAW